MSDMVPEDEFGHDDLLLDETTLDEHGSEVDEELVENEMA